MFGARLLCLVVSAALGCSGDGPSDGGDSRTGDSWGDSAGGDPANPGVSLVDCVNDLADPPALGAHPVVVTADTHYCAPFADQAMSSDPAVVLPLLRDLWPEKSEIRFKPGSYNLPLVAGSYPFAWPHCLATVTGSAVSWPSQDLVVASSSAGNWQLELGFAQADETVAFAWQQWWPPTSSQPTLELDSDDQAEGFIEMVASWCADRFDTGYGRCRELLRCYATSPAAVFTERYVFDGGQLDLDLTVVGGSIAGNTDLAIITRAEGNLSGTPFVQEDHFALGHIPAHHNLGGANLVMLDEPIAGHCGILAAALGVGIGGASPARVITVDCSKNAIQEMTNATGERL